MQSARSQIVTRRTYNREKDDGTFETWEETVFRVILHQKWLWERALGRKLKSNEENELAELRQLMNERKASVAGRTLWLGGTDVAKKREASQFNCAFSYAETVYDFVDVFWLLLQGCGVGFFSKSGCLNGFSTPIKDIEVIRSNRGKEKGEEKNTESYIDNVWTIALGDSAEAWAKVIGKILAAKHPGCKKLVLDFRQVREAGIRLKGYGWISSGDKMISKTLLAICEIMNKKAANLLSPLDIKDIINHLGTVLASRRSAQIAFQHYGEQGWKEFAQCKKNCFDLGQGQREQSNNSLFFHRKPSKEDLLDIFELMVDAGGSEPGFINANAMQSRAPFASGLNPCAEILLANKGFCNLVTIDLAKFRNNLSGLIRACYIIARANYRQTLVDLKDGILSKTWHQNNEFLRLCGVSLTGIARRPDLTAYDLKRMRYSAITGAYSMADDLGLQRPKNVTTIKPEGTISKIFDTTEGVHKPLGKYIFNNITFGEHDPLIPILEEAGYDIRRHPLLTDSIIVKIPIAYEDVEFDMDDGRYVNNDSAIKQLERYKFFMQNWCDQNVSCTISYDISEINNIVNWLDINWDNYVGVSFIYRNDPNKTAEDLGYEYLPQEIVNEEEYYLYTESLKEINLEKDTGTEMIDTDCITGACPVR